MSAIWKDPFLSAPQIFALTHSSITPLTVEQRRRLNLFAMCNDVQVEIIEGMLQCFVEQNNKVVHVDFSRSKGEGMPCALPAPRL
jgi:hypothetical protein